MKISADTEVRIFFPDTSSSTREYHFHRPVTLEGTFANVQRCVSHIHITIYIYIYHCNYYRRALALFDEEAVRSKEHAAEAAAEEAMAASLAAKEKGSGY